MTEQNCVVEWEKVWAKELSVTAFSLFCLFVSMSSEAVPIVAAKYHEGNVKELKEAGLVLQSGINLRLSKDVFKLV